VGGEHKDREATSHLDRKGRDEEDARLLEARDHSTLLASYYPVILLRLRARRLPSDEAEEVRQRVVEHLLRDLRSGKTFDVPFRVVVHQRTTWTLLDYYKERQVRPGELEEHHARDISSLEQVEANLDFERLVQDLPAREREVVVLRWQSGYDAEQIAEALGMKANAVHQALFRAHERLRKRLA
jgi:RNA polymerase sigma factor (sigma-70 family)